jgi:hypothetical protein
MQIFPRLFLAILSMFFLGCQRTGAMEWEIIPATDSSSDTSSDTGDEETDSETLEDSHTGFVTDSSGPTDSDTGSATQDTGSDTVDTDSVTQDTGSATQDSDSDTVDTGSETQDTGSATQDTGSATEDSGSETQDTGSETEEDTGCSPGYQGAACTQICESTVLPIASCSNAVLSCDTWVDGNHNTSNSGNCGTLGLESNCFALDYDLDLSQRFYVHRVRFLSDWWSKRPDDWQLLASDDGVHYNLVLSAKSHANPWQCVQDEPCTPAVPEECCPGGVTQDTSSVGKYYPKWDDFAFTGVVARYWRFRIASTRDLQNLIMRELELLGNLCLGQRCKVSSCGEGVCTADGSGFCSVLEDIAPASCTSAFVGPAPGCTTPSP